MKMDKMKRVTLPYAGEDGKKTQLHSYIAGEKAKWYSQLGKQFVGLSQAVIIIDQQLHSYAFISEKKENIYAKKGKKNKENALCTNVDSNFICNSRKLESAKMSFDR